MPNEWKTANEIAALIEARIERRASIVVMRDHPINGWYAQVIAPGTQNLLKLQAEVDRISDVLRGRYELET
jgi:hypothetical protein